MGVDGDALRAAVPDLASIAGTVDTTLARLRTALDTEGECWGDDETGLAFGIGYAPLRDRAQQAFDELGRAIEAVAGDLRSVADGARAADDRAAARLP
jgi:uncharacterized protein YukE